MSTPPLPRVPPLTPRQVHVWRFSLAMDALTLQNHWTVLSADERQRADRLVFPELRWRFIAARATLRRLLGQYANRSAEDIRLAYGPAGKPELLGGGWHFNISHSGEQALIAIAVGGAVGVDLEWIRPLDYEAMGRGILPEVDRLMLSQAPASAKADLFFRAWVRHEARAKAVGAGLATLADVPAYDLDVGETHRGALATNIPDVQIDGFCL